MIPIQSQTTEFKVCDYIGNSYFLQCGSEKKSSYELTKNFDMPVAYQNTNNIMLMFDYDTP